MLRHGELDAYTPDDPEGADDTYDLPCGFMIISGTGRQHVTFEGGPDDY